MTDPATSYRESKPKGYFPHSQATGNLQVNISIASLIHDLEDRFDPGPIRGALSHMMKADDTV